MTTLTNNQATLSSVQLQQVINELSQFATSDLIEIYNEYADQNSYERIWDNDELTINDLYSSPYDAVRATNNFLYKDSQNYFTYNGYAHMISFDYLQDDNCPIDIEELAQWIVDNELFNDYDIEVTTLDDMLNSIEDNITDAKYTLSKLADYLGQSLNTEQVEQLKTDDEYYEYLVSHLMGEISDYSYDDLYDLINKIDINYSVQ